MIVSAPNRLRLQKMLVETWIALMERPTQTITVKFTDEDLAKEFHDMLMDGVQRLRIGVVDSAAATSKIWTPKDGVTQDQIAEVKSLTRLHGLKNG